MAASENVTKLRRTIQLLGSVRFENIIALLFAYIAIQFVKLSACDAAMQSTVAVFIVGAVMCLGFAMILSLQGVRK
jgi:hypothetical protein